MADSKSATFPRVLSPPCLSSSRQAGLIALTVALLLAVSAPGAAQLGIQNYESWDGALEFERFGEAVAVGDFDGDGYDDIAVGRPGREHLGLANHGMVTVYTIAPDGPGWSVVTRNAVYCEHPSESKADLFFGSSLAVGYFNDDDKADLAVGAPGGSTALVDSAGTVCVIYGGDDLGDRQLLQQSFTDGLPETGDEFGFALAAGDIDGDGYDDLAVGSPGEAVTYDMTTRDDAGAVNLFLSDDAGSGLEAPNSIFRRQGAGGISNEPEEGDRFGASLAIGHFILSGGEGGQFRDLAIGSPGDMGSGTVTVLASGPGSPISTAFAPYWPGSLSWDLLGTADPGDEFGSSLATGDFNGDGGPDLAIGIPGDLGLDDATGAVMVLYGTGNPFGNLSDSGEAVLLENTIDTVAGATPDVDAHDRFGEALAVGDFDGDGYDDLAIGSPYDDSLGSSNSGEVTVVYGASSGLDLTRHQIFDMIFFGGLEVGDQFGWALAAGQTYGGSHDDLVVGLPGQNLIFEMGGGPVDIGGAVAIQSRGPIFEDGFEAGDTTAWQP